MKGQINGEEKREFFSPINTELGVINIFARHVNSPSKIILKHKTRQILNTVVFTHIEFDNHSDKVVS